MNERFQELVAIVLKHEGGYVNDPKDPGGETNYGISRRAFPKEDIKRMTRERAIQIYRQNYWDPARCSEIPAALQPIYFDTAVNAGIVTAIRLLQLAAGIKDDGVFGERTRSAAAYVTPAHYAQQRLAYYDRLIKKNPALERFRKGWNRRVQSFLSCLLITLLFAACASPRKQCRRAEGYIQKAVRICPEAAQLHTQTVEITVPGDSVAVVAAYANPDRDSLVAVISQLAEALQAERELFVIEGAGSNAVVKHQVARALDRVRDQVCYFPPTSIEGETARGMMFIDSLGRPHGRCWCKPTKGIGVVTTPGVTAGPVVTSGEVSTLRSVITWLGWLVAVVFVGLFIRERWKRLQYPPFK